MRYSTVTRTDVPASICRMLGSFVAVSVVLAVFFGYTVAFAEDKDTVIVGHFSKERPGTTLPENWEPMTFDDRPVHTRYFLAKDQGRVVLKAESSASSSGLMRRIAIDPNVFPIVEWQWKIDAILNKGDVMSKQGDDYPARLYITFAWNPAGKGFAERARFAAAKAFLGEYPPDGAINYIWASNAPEGISVPNPYTSTVMMIAVTSGAERAGQWVRERRNIAEDYRVLFKKNPPEISGVALMTDTDNTGESTTAWYGDIVFKKE